MYILIFRKYIDYSVIARCLFSFVTAAATVASRARAAAAAAAGCSLTAKNRVESGIQNDRWRRLLTCTATPRLSVEAYSTRYSRSSRAKHKLIQMRMISA